MHCGISEMGLNTSHDSSVVGICANFDLIIKKIELKKERIFTRSRLCLINHFRHKYGKITFNTYIHMSTRRYNICEELFTLFPALLCIVVVNFTITRTSNSNLEKMGMIIHMTKIHQERQQNKNKHKRPDGLTSFPASGNTHWNTRKHTPNKHVNQEGCETSGKCLRKWLKTLIMFYFGAQNDPKIGPLRPIFKHTSKSS